MIQEKPTNKSPSSSADRGKTNAFVVRPNFAPLKRAMAPTGVEFQGGGRMPTTAAKTIKHRTITARRIWDWRLAVISVNKDGLLPQSESNHKRRKSRAPQPGRRGLGREHERWVQQRRRCGTRRFRRTDRHPQAGLRKKRRPVGVRQTTGRAFEDRCRR